MALTLDSLFRWISHGEDAVSVASATMPELTARLLTVPLRGHIAAMMLAGQARRKAAATISVPETLTGIFLEAF
jgi:hypothetical protein